MSAYDQIARLYDPWSRSVVEDVGFYVEEAVRFGGPVVELGVGTGRIAVPIASAGIPVVGVDTSQGMLDVAGEQARAAGVDALVDLRFGDMWPGQFIGLSARRRPDSSCDSTQKMFSS